MEETAFHRPVLLRETVEHLAVRPGGVYVDATVGEGGHGGAVLAASAPGGVVLGIDLDPRSLSYTKRRLGDYGERFIGVIGNYADMVELARGAGRRDGHARVGRCTRQPGCFRRCELRLMTSCPTWKGDWRRPLSC